MTAPTEHRITLLDLPLELVAGIFRRLDFDDFHAICTLNKYCHWLCTELLRYDFKLKEMGKVDGCLEMDTKSKIAVLEHEDDAWNRLDLTRRARAQLPFGPQNLYDLSSGVCFFGDSIQRHGDRGLTRSLRHADLASFESDSSTIQDQKVVTKDDELQWKLGSDGIIVDCGLSLEEHDLIVISETTRQ